MEAREPLIPEASTHEKSQLYLNRVNLITSDSLKVIPK